MRSFISIILAVSLCSCQAINHSCGWEDDNPIEETAEMLLETQLHFPIDLTPGSPEPTAL